MRMLRGPSLDRPDDPERAPVAGYDYAPGSHGISWADWLQKPWFGLPRWAVLALGVVGFTMLGGRRR